MQRAAIEAVVEVPDFPDGALRSLADEGWRHAVVPPPAAELDPPLVVAVDAATTASDHQPLVLTLT